MITNSYDHPKMCLRYWKSTKTVGESYMIQIYNILSAFYLSANPFIPDTGWLVWSKPYTSELTYKGYLVSVHLNWYVILGFCKSFVQICIYVERNIPQFVSPISM